jgi:bifunctional oligoribonuclease and PAP phosphatase NrnA
MIWDDFCRLVNENQRFLISSHLSLDGDSVGSQLAMVWYLTSRKKQVYVYNCDPVPRKFLFMENTEAISTIQPDEMPEVLIILDCSNLHRLGWNISRMPPIIVNIDHHRDNTRFGTLNVIDDHAAATGAIIYNFFKECNISFPMHVAEALYTAIMTDTGGFRFSNTTSNILRICADLVDFGADSSKIYEKVYASYSPQALLLQARIWSTLKYYLNGKVCCMEMPLSILDEIGAVYSDSEGMADHTITVEGVEVGIMVKYSDTESHFSLRSKGNIDVGKIAQKIPGGGGHFSAAGCTINKPFHTAFPFLLDILKQELG